MGLLFLAAGYSATSATLSIVNKWALVRFPYSGALTVLQFGFAAGAVRLLAALKLVECDALDWKTVKAFAPAVVMFYASIASNMRLLAASTVDTFVVVRSVVPIATQVGELLFFERSVAPAPSALQVASLAVIAIGAAGYGSANAAVLSGAGKESDISNVKGSSLGRFPLVSADFWTSDHLSEESRSVDVVSATRARGTLKLKRR